MSEKCESLGLDAKGRAGVLEKIAEKDPQMAELLKKYIVSFEDLVHMTTSMLQDLLKEIDREDLGRALRAASDELKSYFLSNVSSSYKKDLEEILLGPPLSVDKINESTEKIMRIVREKVDRGTIVLKPDNEEYV